MTHSTATATIVERHDWRVNGMLVVASLILSLLACEFAARLSPAVWGFEPERRTQRVFCSSPAQIGLPHSQLGWTRYPNSRYFEQQSKADGWQLISIDKNGFRKTHGNPRLSDSAIIVLGDSFAFGTLASDHETIAARLQESFPTLAVRNYGMPGYGTGQELQTYRLIGPNEQHDLVVLVYYFGNDLQNNVRPDKFAPRFLLVDKRLDVLPARELGFANARDDERSISALFREHSYLINTVWNLMEDIGREFSTGEIDRGRALTRALLLSLAEEVHKRGARLLIVGVPSWDEIAKRSHTVLTDLQENILQGIAAETPDVIYLPLAAELLKRGGAELYGLDRHLNPRGYFEAASLIADIIIKQKLIRTLPLANSARFLEMSPIVPDCSLYSSQ